MTRTRRPEGQVDEFSPRKGFFLVRGRYALMDPQGDRKGPQLNLIIIYKNRVGSGWLVRYQVQTVTDPKVPRLHFAWSAKRI